MDYVKKIEHATSVKNIGLLVIPTHLEHGRGDFDYQPVFSVFDYGTIKPPVPLDNSTICLMQGFNFELLRNQGIESHYECLVTDQGEEISAKEAIARKIAPTIARVKFVNRIQPKFGNGKWDYSMFQNPEYSNYILPIEFISRNELPASSSVWKRVKRGEITLQDLELAKDFKQGDPVPESLKPILDYSTKFEPEDRYLSPKQAQDLLGFSDKRFRELNNNTRITSDIMTDYAASRGFERLDGKVEYITLVINGVQRDILGDAVCTWHEDRLVTPQGVGISKQRIRDKVKQLNPEWCAEIERAKDYARENGIEDFRTVMKPEIKYNSPNPEFFEAINTLFRAGTNQWADARVFPLYPERHESLEDNLARTIEEFQKVA